MNVQEEGLLYLDSEEEIDLSSELAMEELTLASTPISPLFCSLVNDHYLVSSYVIVCLLHVLQKKNSGSVIEGCNFNPCDKATGIA